MDFSPEIEKQLNELLDIDPRIGLESQIIKRNQLLIAITINKSLINFESIEPLDVIRFVLLIKTGLPLYTSTSLLHFEILLS